jgi:hypothetical protein
MLTLWYLEDVISCYKTPGKVGDNKSQMSRTNSRQKSVKEVAGDQTAKETGSSAGLTPGVAVSTGISLRRLSPRVPGIILKLRREHHVIYRPLSVEVYTSILVGKLQSC